MKSQVAQAAAMIRKHLKANNIDARVTSKSYSMGSSINVNINQDVVPAVREMIETYAKGFQYGHFDGMRDLYEYSNTNDEIPQAKFVFVHFNNSDELEAAAREFMGRWKYETEYELDRAVWSLLAGNGQSDLVAEFWKTQKPRVRVAA
jgi:hypothetical protein